MQQGHGHGNDESKGITVLVAVDFRDLHRNRPPFCNDVNIC